MKFLVSKRLLVTLPLSSQASRRTFSRRKCQLIFAGRSFRQRIPLMKDIGMQVAKLDRRMANTLHPASLTNKLCDKRSPDGNGFERPATCRGFKTNTAGIFVSENAERVEVVVVLDFAEIC